MKKNAQIRLSITRLDEIDISPLPTEQNLQNQLDFKSREVNVQQVRISEMEYNFIGQNSPRTVQNVITRTSENKC